MVKVSDQPSWLTDAWLYSDLSGDADAGNVIFVNPLRRRDFGRLPQLISRPLVVSDHDDIVDTVPRILKRFRALTQCEKGIADLMAALDGAIPAQPTTHKAATLRQLLMNIGQQSDQVSIGTDSYQLPEFALVKTGPTPGLDTAFGRTSIPQDADLNFLKHGDETHVLISNDLGFRQSQFAVAAGFAVSVVNYIGLCGLSKGGTEIETAVLNLVLAPLVEPGRNRADPVYITGVAGRLNNTQTQGLASIIQSSLRRLTA